MADGRNILSTIAQSAVVDLFREYGVTVAPIQRRALAPSSGDAYVGATIRYTDKSMTGSLNLYVPESLITVAKQTTGSSIKSDDFVRELTNQLLGRLKNRLLTYQINLKVGLPRLTGQNATDLRRDDKPEVLEFTFRSLRGEVLVTLQGNINFAAIVYSGGRVAGVEGDVILF